MKIRSMILVLVLCLAAMGAAACGSTSTSASTVTSVAVTGSTPDIGSTSQFTAMATMSDGSTQNVTSTSTWTSSATAFATVSSSGVVTAVAPGITVIQATYLGFIGPVPMPELDYLLCDEFVIPPAYAALYQPQPLYVAPNYQANDSKRVIGEPVSSFLSYEAIDT